MATTKIKNNLLFKDNLSLADYVLHTYKSISNEVYPIFFCYITSLLQLIHFESLFREPSCFWK